MGDMRSSAHVHAVSSATANCKLEVRRSVVPDGSGALALGPIGQAAGRPGRGREEPFPDGRGWPLRPEYPRLLISTTAVFSFSVISG